jgi:hypothetical protein
MGAWGTGIREEDFVLDIQGFIRDCLKDGQNVDEASRLVQQKFGNVTADPEDGPLFWIALADMQWTYGTVDPAVLSRVTDIVKGDAGMQRWGAPEDPLYRKRQAVLQKFLAKISRTNPWPSRPPKRMVRKPKFRAGDCLAVQLETGQYGAALVLATNDTNPEQGMDLVADLDYLQDVPPTLDVFKSRRWLRPTHPDWNAGLSIMWYYPLGFRKVKSRLTVIGNIPVDPDDPVDYPNYGGWHLIGLQILQQQGWDEAKEA